MEAIEIRIKLLNAIFSHFQQVTQWLPNNITFSNNAAIKAEALIEILEIIDCGSIGGFDSENPLYQITTNGKTYAGKTFYTLYDRFLLLVKKYDNENDIKPVCNFNLEKLSNYFTTLYKLREISLK